MGLILAASPGVVSLLEHLDDACSRSCGCDAFPARQLRSLLSLFHAAVATEAGAAAMEHAQRLLVRLDAAVDAARQTEPALACARLAEQARTSDTGMWIESVVWEAHARGCKVLQENIIDSIDCFPTQAQAAVLARRLWVSLHAYCRRLIRDEHLEAARAQMLLLSDCLHACLETCIERCRLLLSQLDQNQDCLAIKKHILVQSHRLRLCFCHLVSEVSDWCQKLEPAMTRSLYCFHERHLAVPELDGQQGHGQRGHCDGILEFEQDGDVPHAHQTPCCRFHERLSSEPADAENMAAA
jgi:hypothetical protein